LFLPDQIKKALTWTSITLGIVTKGQLFSRLKKILHRNGSAHACIWFLTNTAKHSARVGIEQNLLNSSLDTFGEIHESWIWQTGSILYDFMFDWQKHINFSVWFQLDIVHRIWPKLTNQSNLIAGDMNISLNGPTIRKLFGKNHDWKIIIVFFSCFIILSKFKRFRN